MGNVMLDGERDGRSGFEGPNWSEAGLGRHVVLHALCVYIDL